MEISGENDVVQDWGAMQYSVGERCAINHGEKLRLSQLDMKRSRPMLTVLL